MFTGIVERTARLASVAQGAGFLRLNLAAAWTDVKPGESIAINGVCLTVAEIGSKSLAFDVIPETLAKTNLGLLAAGDVVNVERSLRIGDRMDGHFVLGHVDDVGKLLERSQDAGDYRLKIECPSELARFLTPKGSITVDGVALTLASIQQNTFEVAIIPTTLAITTLDAKPIGWPFNLEMDVLAKTTVNYLDRIHAGR